MKLFKKELTVLSIILLVVMMGTITIPNITLFFNNVYAAAAESVNMDPGSVTGTSSDVSDKVTSIGGTVLGVFQAAGVALSVIILVYIGIKYLLGSAEEKAEYKKSMIPYIVGAIVIFGASAIAGFIKNTATSTLS